jgi:hypothetical protein
MPRARSQQLPLQMPLRLPVQLRMQPPVGLPMQPPVQGRCKAGAVAAVHAAAACKPLSKR